MVLFIQVNGVTVSEMAKVIKNDLMVVSTVANGIKAELVVKES